jgi:branched-chain amino acid transport system ATP-binding protein
MNIQHSTHDSKEMDKTSLLQVSSISVHFGGIMALDKVSFDIHKGKIFGLIGPNGAGKTTLFNCLSRIYNIDEGDILFEGKSILNKVDYNMCDIGIGRTFQNLALFSEMSVLDNVMVGGHHRTKSDYFSNALGLPWARREDRKLKEEVMELIDYLELNDVMDTEAGSLPFGTQKRIELARALASRPKLLLLDEPAGGLNHDEVEELVAFIHKMRDEKDLTILLVEHHMNLVMQVSDQVAVLNFGTKIADDIPEKIQQNPEVIKAYLGTESS